jgi:molybdopterin synthase catalytic subunit
MNLSYNKKKLNTLIQEYQKREGIVVVKIWLNEGKLEIGDDIMYALVAGRFRTDVLPVLGELVYRLKNELIRETEI